jgi:hypothetical protein
MSRSTWPPAQVWQPGAKRVLLLSATNANADGNIPLRQPELHLERSGLAWNVIRP